MERSFRDDAALVPCPLAVGPSDREGTVRAVRRSAETQRCAGRFRLVSSPSCPSARRIPPFADGSHG
eukprot:555097-Alexandrium_andersonii.AAC.1